MSDYQNEFVGNDTAEVVDTNAGQSTDAKVNPGAIRKSTTNNILNALSNASGQQFESVEAALAYMARTAAQQGSAPVGHAQPVEPPRQSNGRVTTNDLHEQFNKLQMDLARKEQALREKELDSEIMRYMGDKFDSDLTDYAIQKVKSNIRWNEDGTYSIVNQKGQERYGMDGNPLTVSGLVSEVAKGNPKLLKQSGLSGGSGLRQNANFAGAPEEGIPDYSKDPAAFNAWAQRNGLGKRVGLKATTVEVHAQQMSRKIL
jgi:hypothetical protein